MRNQGNYIISVELLCQWLAQQAEALGINLFPDFAASSLLFSEDSKAVWACKLEIKVAMRMEVPAQLSSWNRIICEADDFSRRMSRFPD